MDTNYKYMVYVSCMTYNHAPYIKDALDSFCMQQTNFPYVCGIIDDASTDDETVILSQYLEEHFELDNQNVTHHEETKDYLMTFSQHKVNRNCFFVVLFLKYNHRQAGKKPKFPYVSRWRENSKYCAFCEGDDYWVVPNKLQMQIDFLESHPDYVLCHTDFEATVKLITHYKEKHPDGNYFPYLLNDTHIMIGSLTVVYRIDAYDAAPKLFQGKGWPMGDKPLWYELASLGKIKYIPVITAMYRILDESAAHSRDIEKEISFHRAERDITRFYAAHFGVPLLNDGYTSSYYDTLLYTAYKYNRFDIAEKYYKEAKEKGAISSKGILLYLACKFSLIGRVLSIIVKRANGEGSLN